MPTGLVIYTTALFVAASCCFAAATVTVRRRSQASCTVLALLLVAGGIWALGFGLRTLATTLEGKLLWTKVLNVGAVPAATLWFVLVVLCAGLGATLTRRNLLLLSLQPALLLVLIATFERQSFFAGDWRLETFGGWPFLQSTKGSVFWANQAYVAILILWGLGILIWRFRATPRLFRRHAAVLALALLVPWGGNLLDLARVATSWHPFVWPLNFVPLCFALGCAPIIWATRRLGLLELVPVARERLFDAMTDGFLVVDRKRRIVDHNHVASALLGVDGQLIGLALDEALSEAALGEDFWNPHQPTRFELAGERPESRPPLELRSMPLADSAGRHQGWMVIARDIRRQKRDEAERRELERQLQQAQKQESLGLMAGGIAHDFNNIFMAMMGNAELGLLDTPEDSPARDSLEQIHEGLTRATELARQMLAYAGKATIEPVSVDVSKTIREFRELLVAATPMNVALRFELADELPAVNGDPSQLRQVVMNLVVNAAEALDGKRGTVTIRTRYAEAGAVPGGASATFPAGAAPLGPQVQVQVLDDGAGIDPEIVPSIFDPFFSTKFAGRGLGLASVLGIVRAHGGRIHVARRFGGGTVFTVALAPCAAVEAPAAAAHGRRDERALRATILIADDEPAVRQVARRMLQRLGCRVLEACDGDDAVAVFRDRGESIDAVIIDLTMPGLSGEETLHAIRSLRPEIPAVLCSGYDAEDTKKSLTQLQIADFLEKPYTLSRLRRSIDRAFGRAVA